MLINKNKFLKILSNLNNLIKEDKTNLLKNINLINKNTHLIIIYKNSKLQIKIKKKIISKENKFNIFVSFLKIYNLIKNLKSEIITIKLKKKNLLIFDKKTKFKIKISISIKINEIKFKKKFKNYLIKNEDLSKLINKTEFIINKNNFNCIKGIFFIFSKLNILAMSTDNYKYSFCKINIESNFVKSKFIINIETIKLIKEILKQKKFKLVKLQKNKNLIKISIKNIIIISYLILDDFPVIKKLYFKNFNNYIILNRNEIKLILKRSTNIFKKNNNNYNQWEHNNNLLKIKTKCGNEIVTEKIKTNNKNLKFKISINTKYFIEFINSVKCEQYKFIYYKKEKTVIVRILNDVNYLYIITTLKI